MEQEIPSSFDLKTGTDLAFALVVFISFFSAFSSSPVTSIFIIMVIIILGIAYVSNGIYGFAYVRKSKSLFVKAVYFFSQFLMGGLIIYYGRGAGFSPLILLPLVAHAVITLDDTWSLFANFGLLITYAVSVWGFSHSLGQVWQGFPVFFSGQVIILIFTQMAVTEQKARQNLENLARELSEANQRLSKYAEQVQEMAVTQERNRFAREIHDGLGHYLTTIHMQVNAAKALVYSDPEKATEMLIKAKDLTTEALVDVRDSVYALRKESVDIDNLPVRIRQLVDVAKTANREVVLNVIGEPIILSPQANLTLYRTAQETLNNAQKHSQASKIELILDYSEADHVILTARDNGIGAVELKNGYGILGIQERARLLKGEVSIENQPGKGFVITIDLPVKP